MGEEHGYPWPPIGAPLHMERDDDGRSFDSSVNAVSFGFVATAILISMFLVMAIFEKFLRPTSPALAPSGRRSHADLEAQLRYNGKLGHPSPKMTIYASGVSVLMPGNDIPTFIAQPAPIRCPPERISWPQHHHASFSNPAHLSPSYT
ncbi:uncharacterized protein LOC133802156 [Humulus lupulus]|uniref:uncharacterized protein LOC133802156 n=1 Tax=Humulus lupulus TaxID=3486 RepID=UPI002B408935|nr:uncharacterized protein LOC133802156 [Humulus lupulus]